MKNIKTLPLAVSLIEKSEISASHLSDNFPRSCHPTHRPTLHFYTDKVTAGDTPVPSTPGTVYTQIYGNRGLYRVTIPIGGCSPWLTRRAGWDESLQPGHGHGHDHRIFLVIWFCMHIVNLFVVQLLMLNNNNSVPSVAEWSKALESDASAGGESPVRAPVRAATLACVFVAGTAQMPDSVSGRRGPCPIYRAR